jgi:hypothetical protein
MPALWFHESGIHILYPFPNEKQPFYAPAPRGKSYSGGTAPVEKPVFPMENVKKKDFIIRWSAEIIYI